MKINLGVRKCKVCGCNFVPTSYFHIYCGSRKDKSGCSWKKYLEGANKYSKTEKSRKVDNLWKKKARKNNTKYAQRQRKLNREYHKKNKEWFASYNKKWRKNNLQKVLDGNRRRLLLKRGVGGFHTNKEWENLKKKYNYCCAKCGISEKELTELWKNTNFYKLTRDHIKPTSRGGTDDISNIQPLCISCNASKKDNL
jgi:hypothetical protein